MIARVIDYPNDAARVYDDSSLPANWLITQVLISKFEVQVSDPLPLVSRLPRVGRLTLRCEKKLATFELKVLGLELHPYLQQLPG